MNDNYDPGFDILLNVISNNNATKDKLEKYVVHRKKFGIDAAKRKYPECHNLQIGDPQLKYVWKNLLKIVDKL